MTGEQARYRYLTEPRESPRFGRFLGINLIPFKTCSLDCVYCQIGPTTRRTLVIAEHLPVDDIIAELGEWLGNSQPVDWLVLMGPGEATLNLRFGAVIEFAKHNTDIPVAVLTNGTLLWDDQVRRDICRADVVVPSLDSATAEGFERINRPPEQLRVEQLIEGIAATVQDCPGQVWLEVMALRGLNDTPGELAALRRAITHINPARVQVNTVTQAPAHPIARPLPARELQSFAKAISPHAEVLVAYDNMRAERLAGNA